MIRRHTTLLCAIGLLTACAPSALAGDRAARSNSLGAKRVTLNIAKGDIRDALRLVAEQGDLNLIIGPAVEGEVSVYLTDASLETALRAITVNNGFEYSVEDDVISVSKRNEPAKGAAVVLPPMITRVFTLQAQDAQRVADALVDALSRDAKGRPRGKIRVLNENSDPIYYTQQLSQLGGSLSGSDGGAGGGAFGGGGLNNGAQSGGGTGGSGIVGGQGGSRRARNARILVVTDIKENVDRIADLIADLDTLPPQVLIEARIVEMSTNLERQLGIDWNIDIRANGPILNHELPLQWEAGFATGSQIRRAPNGRPFSSTGLALGSIDFSSFTAVVRAHAGDNALRILANPRLLVFNNHSASILVGERYPLLEANITDFGTLTESFDTYIPIGVQLEVTPTVMMDGRISMMVHPTTSSLGDDVIGTTGLRVARINTRELDTRVIMHDGQTIVLGGLISDRKSRTVNKLPGLGDLPFLSLFFRQESPTAERVDLLIFLTVHVEGSAEISERDREVFDKYRPHFKQIEQLQDVPLHFEIPSEYAPPRPMFGDPPDPTPAELDVSDDSPEPAEQKEFLLKSPRPQPNRPVSISAIEPAQPAAGPSWRYAAQSPATDPMED